MVEIAPWVEGLWVAPGAAKNASTIRLFEPISRRSWAYGPGLPPLAATVKLALPPPPAPGLPIVPLVGVVKAQGVANSLSEKDDVAALSVSGKLMRPRSAGRLFMERG